MKCTISQIYFGKELYMFLTDLLSIIRSLNTVYTAIGICHASYVDCLLARSGPFHISHLQFISVKLLLIAFVYCQWEMGEV